MNMEEVEHRAREQAVKQFPDEVAATLGGIRAGFIEGAMWMAKQKSTKPSTGTKH